MHKRIARKTVSTRCGMACGAVLQALESRYLLSGVSPLTTGVSEPPLENLGPISDLNPESLQAPYSPSNLADAYGFNNIFFNSTPGNGTGQTIAIVDAYNDPDIASDANVFSNYWGLPEFNDGGPTFTVLGQTGTSTLPANSPSAGGWDLEESLDVEWAHSVAPDANIVLFEANSNSNSDLFNTVQTAADYAGVSVVSMSFGGAEFSGETSDDSIFTTPAGHSNVTFIASSGDTGGEVIYPSVSPNVLAVGGTTLTVNNNGSYSSETSWADGGGGVSVYEPQPTYQSNFGLTYAKRSTPDVAMDADPNTGVYVLDSFYDSSAFIDVGGTSLAAPLWAGLTSIIDQGRALRSLAPLDGPSQMLPGIYALNISDFNDVLTGSNGFQAGPGYDLATGRGSPVLPNLVADMVQSYTGLAFTQPPTTTTVGQTIDPSTGIKVAVQTPAGQTITTNNSAVTLTLSSGTFVSTGTSSVTVNAVNGVATFGGLSINSAGIYTVTATDGGLTSAPATLPITAATQLAFVQAPAVSAINYALAPSVEFQLENAADQLVTTTGVPITVSWSSGEKFNPDSTVTVTTVNGVANFTNLIPTVAGNFNLTASSGSLTGATSSTIDLIALANLAAPTINRSIPPTTTDEGTTATFTVTFNDPVTGVTPSAFAVVLGQSVTANAVVAVSPSPTSYGEIYTVTVSGISGSGTLGLNLVNASGISNQGGGGLPRAFQMGNTYALGGTLGTGVLADVNGDSKLDLIEPAGSSGVDVLLGNGNGTFQAAQTLAISGTADQVVVADINGDGSPDILVGASNGIDLFLGNGNGTFKAARTITTETYRESIVVGDFNSDGKPDIFAETPTSGGADILLTLFVGNGNGTFKDVGALELSGTYYGSLSTADLNGDGRPDMVLWTKNKPEAATILTLGNYSFSFGQTLLFNGKVSSGIVGDINGDNIPDIVAAVPSADQLAVYVGNGNGTFQSEQTFALGGTGQTLAMGDFNGDGNKDIAVGYLSPAGTDILLGNGNGTFGPAQPVATSGEPVAAGDLNGDGLADLVVGNLGGSPATISVLLGNNNLQAFTGQNYTIDPAPMVTINSFASTYAGESFSTTGSFTDQDASDTWTATVDYGEGAGPQPLTLNSNKTFSLGGTYASPGNYTITVVVKTTDGGTGTAQLPITVSDPPGVVRAAGATYTIMGSPALMDVTGGMVTLTADISATFPGYGLQIENGANVTLESNETLGSVKLNGNGSMDVGSNQIIINYGTGTDPITTIQSYLTTGYNGGAWNGGGMFSTAAQMQTNGLSYALGSADYAQAPGFVAGLSSGQIEVKYTLVGDVDLNSFVNGVDFARLAQYYNKFDTNWDDGNFNYGTAIISGIDFSELSKNFGYIATTGASVALSAADWAALDEFEGIPTLAQSTLTVGSKTILSGTKGVLVSGEIASTGAAATGSVTIKLNGKTQTARIKSDGTFSATFSTILMQPGKYSIVCSYAGSSSVASSTGSGTLNVTDGVKTLFNTGIAVKPGKTLGVKVALTDAGGTNVSNSLVTLTATGLVLAAKPGVSVPLNTSANGGLGALFAFSGPLGSGVYTFDLSTTGLAAGTYLLYFTASGDPVRHQVRFTVA